MHPALVVTILILWMASLGLFMWSVIVVHPCCNEECKIVDYKETATQVFKYPNYVTTNVIEIVVMTSDYFVGAAHVYDAEVGRNMSDLREYYKIGTSMACKVERGRIIKVASISTDHWQGFGFAFYAWVDNTHPFNANRAQLGLCISSGILFGITTLAVPYGLVSMKKRDRMAKREDDEPSAPSVNDDATFEMASYSMPVVIKPEDF